MKKRSKYIIVIVLFVLIMSIILYIFYNKRKDISLLNEAKSLLEYIYNLDEKDTDYTFFNGYISKDSNEFKKKFNIDGEGNINVDKYGNVKFYINTSEYCINKTSTGNIKLIEDKCDHFEELNVKTIKNNTTISFTSLDEELEYKVSSNDDFIGEWIKQEYSGNLIINTYREGKNYIWFRNKDGVISEVLTFEVDCLNTSDTSYDKNLLYCSGSTVTIDNMQWIVIEDKMSSIKLMSKDGVGFNASHCTNYKSDFCYKTQYENIPYKWSNSYINYYLNNAFINRLSSDTVSKLISSDICDDNVNLSCDGESCLGTRKDIIESKRYSCSEYTTSLIRLIDYNEYNYIYSHIGNNDLIVGDYWIMNSYSSNKGSIVDANYEVYVLEDVYNSYDIRPLIILDKMK